jgi:hypothetical protein
MDGIVSKEIASAAYVVSRREEKVKPTRTIDNHNLDVKIYGR